ncbi:hypothetical protein IJ103_03650, partial [Candidatus Saccharibacteria bacterium]|nr:hypothetical protein [Candidatus Saccharibacteria bacterium]
MGDESPGKQLKQPEPKAGPESKGAEKGKVSKKKQDIKAEIGRKRKENYYKIKAKVLEAEKNNRESLYVVEMPDGWYMMMGNSAVIYANDLANRLKISVKIIQDRDYRHTAIDGIVTFQDLEVFERRMRELKIKQRHRSEGIIIYDLGKDAYTDEKIEELKHENEVRIERANKLIVPEVILPELKLRLQELSRAIHPGVRNMDPAGRDLVGREIDGVAGKLVEDFFLAANGWDDMFLFRDRSIRDL